MMKNTHRLLSLAAILTGATLAATSVHATVLYGPTAYRSFADSPFHGNSLAQFYLEDFEDGMLDTPGVTAVANQAGVVLGTMSGSPYVDSVDGDDGTIDGSGSGGRSFGAVNNVSSEAGGYTFTFDATVLGALPTHVGIVWTDGGFHVPTRFEAFDATGASLGVIGPVDISDTSWMGSTAEDRFFGIYHAEGIASFTIRDPGGINNLEVDHLQYGLDLPAPGAAVPESPVGVLALSTLLGLVARGRGWSS